MAKLNKKPVAVPLFASVMSPQYSWSEYETSTLQGHTAFPKTSKGEEAYVEVPALIDSPDARAIRKHEMLHIAFTPAINSVVKKLAKEGLDSYIAVQLAEDMRLSHIAKDNSLHGEEDYFSQETVLGLVNQLMDGAQAAEATDNKQNFTVAAVAMLAAMYNQPFHPLRDEEGELLESDCLDDNIKRLTATAEAAYGEPGREAMERIMGDVKARNAAFSVYDYAASAYYVDGPTKDSFECVMRHTHEVLEALLYNEELPEPPPPVPAPCDESPEAPKDPKGTEGAPSGQGGEPDKAPDEEKPDKAENGPQPEPTPEQEAEQEVKEEQKKADNQISSRALDAAATLMGASVTKAAADVLRRKTKKDAEARIEYASDSEAPQGDYAPGDPDSTPTEILVHVENLDLSMDTNTEINWAPMTIFAPPLERAFKVRVPRRGRPSLEGDTPRHLSRWFADRSILDNRGRRPGGTLLIDVSGSMKWSHEQTMALINATPAMTIALYSSGDEFIKRASGALAHSGNGFRGRLTIIARQGKVISPDYNWRALHGMSNACDGPALAWLARQPGPRVWFSDGEVTVMDHSGRKAETATAAAFDEATRILMLGNILRTTSQEDVVRIFTGLPPKSAATSRDCGQTSKAPGLARMSAFSSLAYAHATKRAT